MEEREEWAGSAVGIPKVDRSYKINITYFKDTGKFYAEGHYDTTKLGMDEIFDDVRGMYKKGSLPGLTPFSKFDYMVVDSKDHPHAYPRLIIQGQ